MFGKSYADYLRFQAPILVAVAFVGAARLGLSLAGEPNSVVKYLSMTAVGFAGIFYYGLQVRRTGFGSYRNMLPLIFNQGLIAHAIAILGIGLSAMGMTNAFDAPEFRGPGSTADTTPLTHALAHIFIGPWAGTLVGWLMGSIVMALAGGSRREAS